MAEEPHHSEDYKKSHPHIHEVKYKGKGGKEKIYVYRYGTIESRKKKSTLDKVRNE